MTIYKLIDRQGMGYKENSIWETKEELRKDLINYHQDVYGNYSDEELAKVTLESVLDTGTWELVEEDVQKYKVEMLQSEVFIVDVYAKDQKQAEELANESFSNGDYQDTGNLTTSVGMVYDVTNTDDPFYPTNN